MQDENDQLYYVVIDDQKQISYFPYAELNFDQNEVRHKLSQEYQSWQIKAIHPATSIKACVGKWWLKMKRTDIIIYIMP